MFNSSFSQVISLFQRYWYLQFRAVMRILDVTYWPMIDLILFGFFALWTQKTDSGNAILLATLVNAILWQVVYRANLGIATYVMEELWERNLENLFATPIKFWQWVLSFILVGILTSFMTIFSCAFASWIFYQISFNLPLWFMFLIILVQFISGWAYGMITGGLLFYFGKNAQSLPWALAWLTAPFAGIIYPITILPYWMQIIAKAIPMKYIFEAVRQFYYTGNAHYHQVYFGLGLSLVYFSIAYAFFYWMFEGFREKGLSQLY